MYTYNKHNWDKMDLVKREKRKWLVFAPVGVLLLVTIFASGALMMSSSFADDSHVDDVSIIVPISCNLNSYNTTHSETVNPNTTEEDIGKTTLQAFCNDNDGFAIYAIGYTGNVDGTTTLVGNNTSLTIATSTNTSSSSSWSMKVTKETNTNTAYLPNNMTINNGYDSYSVVPTNWTKVATFSSATDTEEPNGKGAVLYTTYKVHIAPGQAADTYSGKVKYTLFHPSTSCLYYTVHFNPGDGSGYMADQPICNNGSTALSTNTFIPPTGYEFKEWNTAPDGSGTSYTNEQIINTNLADVGESITLYAMWWNPPYLYKAVQNLSKGTLAQNNVALTDEITTPTSTNKDQDTSNSGVYTYDPAVYGVASDASNDYPIYFYRGILETNPGTYGSSGSANTYPNYVKLGNNTCWRIIRTTGSGGVKMIYSGTYGATTSGSCANDSSRIITQNKSSFNSSIVHNNIHAVGYTYNNSMNGVTTDTSVDTVFGSNANPGLNNTRSTIKIYIEDTWYTNNMTSYTNMLEASAGYCNDRTLYSNANTSPIVATSVVPYRSSGSSTYTRYFGSYIRNIINGYLPSLTCPRSTVDLYRYVSNSNGLGNELKYPVALITADELSFVGNGYSNSSASAYSKLSFLSYLTSGYQSGNGGDPNLSPSHHALGYGAYVRAIRGDDDYDTNFGRLVDVYTDRQAGVRPVISLVHSTTIASGSGTATDPWLIDE